MRKALYLLLAIAMTGIAYQMWKYNPPKNTRQEAEEKVDEDYTLYHEFTFDERIIGVYSGFLDRITIGVDQKMSKEEIFTLESKDGKTRLYLDLYGNAVVKQNNKELKPQDEFQWNGNQAKIYYLENQIETRLINPQYVENHVLRYDPGNTVYYLNRIELEEGWITDFISSLEEVNSVPQIDNKYPLLKMVDEEIILEATSGRVVFTTTQILIYESKNGSTYLGCAYQLNDIVQTSTFYKLNKSQKELFFTTVNALKPLS